MTNFLGLLFFSDWSDPVPKTANYKIMKPTDLNVIVVRHVLDIILVAARIFTSRSHTSVAKIVILDFLDFVIFVVTILFADFLDGEAGRELTGRT